MIRTTATALAAAVLLATSGASAADAPPIKIGFVFSYDGAMTTYGHLVDDAITAWMNVHGDTIGGRKVVIIKRDDTGIAPEVAKRLATELITQDNVDVLAGIEFTPNAIAVGDVSTQSKRPFFNLNAATSGIITKNPYMTRLGFTTAQITEPLAKWAFKNGIKRAYVLYTDYGPGVDASKAFAATFTAAGGTIVGNVGVPVTNSDFSAYVQRIKDEKPQAVYLFLGSGAQPGQFLRSFTSAGLKKSIKLLAAGDLVDENLLPTFGDQADGLITSLTYSNSHASKENAAFRKALAAVNGGKNPADFNAVAAWDIMHAIYAAIGAQNGGTDPDKIMASLKGMKWESPRGPVMIDPQTRGLVENVYIRRTEKKNGQYVNTEIDSIPMVRDPYEK